MVLCTTTNDGNAASSNALASVSYNGHALRAQQSMKAELEAAGPGFARSGFER